MAHCGLLLLSCPHRAGLWGQIVCVLETRTLNVDEQSDFQRLANQFKKFKSQYIQKSASLPPLESRACAGKESTGVLENGKLCFSEEGFSSRGGSWQQRPHPPGSHPEFILAFPVDGLETWVGCWVTGGARVE